ncbi:MAG: phenylalanine--tRNA ligase subunit beta [Nitrosopumilaceae archaeon]|nr:phenylalanine--tRNA ligase subunit beta [Nitrosopumilaceae archaeon]
MPVITLNLPRLKTLIGQTIKTKDLIESLTALGLDIEEQNQTYVKIEYSPNRPDYATDFGIASALKSFLQLDSKTYDFKIVQSDYKIKIDQNVKKIRPYLSAIVAKSSTNLNNDDIKQLITLQEDLHNGLGKKRSKASIGLHDLDKLSFPLLYTTAKRSHKFVPLGKSSEFTLTNILNQFDIGEKYNHLLPNNTYLTIIKDHEGKTISFPPIINSAYTTITNKTRNILIEVTATDDITANDVLSILVSTICSISNYKFYNIKIGDNNISSQFRSRKITLDVQFVNNILGLQMSENQIVESLQKNRLYSYIQNGKIICTIPRSRFDILGKIDLVEEILIGHGLQNLQPELPSSNNLGNKSHITKYLESLTMIMIGLGYNEVLNQSLIDKRIHYTLTQTKPNNLIKFKESLNRNYILRNSITPSLLYNISKNIHNSYPQKLFELGTIFMKSNLIEENINLACIQADQSANFTAIKSTLQSIFKPFGISFKTQRISSPIFSYGHAASIIFNSNVIGVIGEISKDVLHNFKIRVPVASFEIKLTGLLFEN